VESAANSGNYTLRDRKSLNPDFYILYGYSRHTRISAVPDNGMFYPKPRQLLPTGPIIAATTHSTSSRYIRRVFE